MKLILITIALTSLIHLTKSQMIPISEVKTHPPPGSNPRTTQKSSEDDAKAKEKAKVHAKIAEAHLAATADSNPESFESEDNANPKAPQVFRKDKPLEFQNPEKHASEAWLLNFLLERYAKNSQLPPDELNVVEQADILQNLEHFAHKYENGRDLFESTNALADILLPALNSSHVELRSGACSVFAIAAQNNHIVQSKAYKGGVIRPLVHLLTADTGVVRAKALYAITALVRNYPLAQEKFIQDGGILALIKIAYLPETRKRSLTFVTDLLNERKECDELAIAIARAKERKTGRGGDGNESEDVSDDPCDKRGVLATALQDGGWCNILEDSVKNLVGFGDEEQILIVEAVESSLKICTESLRGLRRYFEKLLVKFSGDEEMGDLVVGQLNVIIEALKLSAKQARTEL